jgi:hypothetical protein
VAQSISLRALPSRIYPSYALQVGRGCKFLCSFVTWHAIRASVRGK